jgi:hypothetical protein
MSEDIPVDVACILEPNINPIKHSHIFTDSKVIAEDDVLEFQFPEQSRAEPLITYTHIKFLWPNAEQISASYYIAAVTPAEVLPLSSLIPIRRGQWLRLQQPIPTMPLEDSLIVAVLNIEDNLQPNQPTFISMKLAGFDHLYTYADKITFQDNVKLVCNGLNARFTSDE